MGKAEILAAVQRNKPETTRLPLAFIPPTADHTNLCVAFSGMLNQIGGQVLMVEDLAAVKAYVHQHYGLQDRVVTTISSLQEVFESPDATANPHDLADVALAILPGHFGVAENGAIWLSDDQLGHRVLPFICQHLALVIKANQLVANLHEAYERIGNVEHPFGVFIAGPSKTADIEQSLVIGAHGARSLTVFLLQQACNDFVQR